MDDATIVVGMIFDTIGSMSDKLQKAKQAALDYFETSNPEDKFMLIGFSELNSLSLHLVQKIPVTSYLPRSHSLSSNHRMLKFPALSNTGTHGYRYWRLRVLVGTNQHVPLARNKFDRTTSPLSRPG